MAFTDHCDVFGSFHEDGFNRIVDHIRFQRPSMFNYATQAIADNPALLCRPIVAHPRLNQHGNPLVTIIDPLPLPGSNFALNFSVQLVDVKAAPGVVFRIRGATRIVIEKRSPAASRRAAPLAPGARGIRRRVRARKLR